MRAAAGWMASRDGPLPSARNCRFAVRRTIIRRAGSRAVTPSEMKLACSLDKLRPQLTRGCFIVMSFVSASMAVALSLMSLIIPAGDWRGTQYIESLRQSQFLFLVAQTKVNFYPGIDASSRGSLAYGRRRELCVASRSKSWLEKGVRQRAK